MSVFNELKRRNVFRVGAAYVVSAWLIIQVVETLFPVFDFSNESIRLVVLTLAIGLLPMLFFAWAFEMTPGGIKREKDIDRSQSITHQTGRKLDRTVIFLLAAGLAFFAFDKFILDPSRDAAMVETATQDAIQAIADQLKMQLLGQAPPLVMSKQTETEVYELYLQARQLIYERKQKSMGLAAQLLERALFLDPAYAPAHAQLGIATLLLDERNYGTIPHDQARIRALKHLDTALDLDPNLAEAWAGQGLYHGGMKSIEPLEKALSINPNLLDALNWMQMAKASQGDAPGATAIVERMLEIDPLYVPAVANAIYDYNLNGQPEKSWALLGKV